MGVSTDWKYYYKTVSPTTIKISQKSFLDLISKGHCYHKESPALWCNECLTSIAQAELETKTIKTLYRSTMREDCRFIILTYIGSGMWKRWTKSATKIVSSGTVCALWNGQI